MRNLKRVLESLTAPLLAALLLTPAYAQEQVYSLEECIQMATASNELIKAEELKIDMAKAKKGEVGVNFFPKVSLGAAYSHIEDPLQPIDWDHALHGLGQYLPEKIKNKTAIDLGNTRVGTVSFVQPIFMGGKIINGYKMASSAVDLAGIMMETKERELELSVEDTYWQVVTLSSKLELATRLTALLDEAVANVDLAVKEGVATEADALSIRVKQSDANQLRLKVENGLSLSKMLLAQKCGLGLESDYRLADEVTLDTARNEAIDTPILLSEQEISGGIDARPEVRALETADKIFAAKERVELADALPKVVLLGGYTTINPNLFAGMQDEYGGSWHVAVGLQIPLTDIYTGITKRKGAAAERGIKQRQLTDAREKINLQIHQLLLNNQEAYKQLSAAKLSLSSADETLRQAQLGYREGVIPLLVLTEAQTSWSVAYDSYIDAAIALKSSESKIKHYVPTARFTR
ncbi:TolC family protein [uncultured Porphyromonas sp.]|uniref:TolC family protein n=1 Tax=uncultured Porphyromonas sp. TaxID=159274 RepID=UPI00261DB94A|nr:TolC family protein [uncultured Porphyromonas sp.]